MRYVKPHGALYNRAVHDEDQAAAVVAALVAYDPTLPLLGLPGSALLRHAEQAGLTAVTEAFADRGYTAQATLVPRSQPGALLHDPAAVGAAHGVDADAPAGCGRSTVSEVAVSARSICVHGDYPGRGGDGGCRTQGAGSEAGVEIRPFAS